MTFVSGAITSNLRHRNPPVDPFFDSVVLLLPFDGNDGDTTTTDYSLSAHDITFAGNAEIDTAVSKFSSASYIGDGNGDYVSAPDSTDWDFGTGDFTIEAWMNPSGIVGTEIYTFVSNYLSSVSGISLQWRNDGGFVGGSLVAGWGDTVLSRHDSWTPTDDTWYHIAWARSGTSLKLFLDGAEVDSDTNSTDMTGSTAPMHVGQLRAASPTFSFLGNIDDVRITKGVARYTAAFTPPSQPHPRSSGFNTPQPTFSNVEWLMGFEGGTGTGTFTEESSNGWTVTPNSSAQRTTTQAKFGSNSGETIGGTLSRFTIDDNAALEVGSSDFSVEAFVRFDTVSVDATFFCCWHGSTEKTHIWWWDQSASAMTYQYSTNGTATANTFTSSWSPSQDTWYHVAVCRNGADLRMFVDGAQIGVTHDMSTDTLHNSTRQKHVGFSNTTINGLNGFTDEFRFVIGEGIYTSNFTAPTAAHPRS